MAGRFPQISQSDTPSERAVIRRVHCEAGADCRSQHCARWHELDLIFCQVNGKPLHGHNLTRRDLTALCARARVPAIRMHDLRHLHNTTLMREGVNPKVVKERAGHSSVGFTLERYSWVTPDMQEVALEALTRSLARAPDEETDATGLLPEPPVAAARTGPNETAETRA